MVNIYEKVIGIKQDTYIEYLKEETGKYTNIILISTEKIGVKLFDFLHRDIDISEIYLLNASNNFKTYNEQIVIKTSLSEFEADKNSTVCIIGATDRNKKIIKNRILEFGFNNIIDSPNDLTEILKIGPVPFDRKIVEITTKVGCSINCKFCPQRLFIKNYNMQQGNGRLSLENFTKILDNLPDEIIIDFAGMSEPFLNHEAIDMIELCNKRKHPVFLASTLVGLKPEHLERLKKCDISFFCLHLPDDEENSNIPVTETYIRVLDEMLDFRKKNGKRFIDTTNCHGKIKEKVREIIRGRVDINENVELNDRAGNLKFEREMTIKKGMLACRNQLLFDRFVVLPDGTVILCCMDYGLEHIMGNLIKEDLNSILNGVEYKSIIKGALSTNSDILCRKCAAAIDCSLY